MRIWLLDGEQPCDAFRIVDVGPLVGDSIAAEEITDAVADCGRPVPDQDELRSHGTRVVVDHRHGARSYFMASGSRPPSGPLSASILTLVQTPTPSTRSPPTPSPIAAP